MKLTLTLQPNNQVAVHCDGQRSHTFELAALFPDATNPVRPPHPLEDPVAYGQVAYQALFPHDTIARHSLEAGPRRIFLLVEDDQIQVIPWEYTHNSSDFLVLKLPFVRGINPIKPIPAPDLGGTPAHIIAIPSNPLHEDIITLNIPGEWQRLKEIVDEIPQQITLERAHPPTIDKLRAQVANRQHRIVHFMGHGDQYKDQAVLLFENEHGGIDPVLAEDFALTVQDHVFLVTLNACVSATPGETEFSNLAAALVERQIPYALGMRFSIPDVDALAFSRSFYAEIAAGTPVESALFQARRSMHRKSKNPFAVGIPVLYTSLGEAVPGFSPAGGTPSIHEGKPQMDVNAIPRAEGAFQGRVPELLALGEALTGDQRSRLLTIHGGGGQGKTALAREAVERFAHAWPGGVWAISLENLPSRLEFAARLADFLGIPREDLPEPAELERRALIALGQRRALLVLDNAETLVEAVEQQDAGALDLAAFLREHIAGTLAGLLVTSRYRLGWIAEKALELGGLTDQEGARLFRQSAPIRQAEIPLGAAQDLSARVFGHPLALRLLGLAFDAEQLNLADFTEQYEEHLVEARDKYRQESHRHHSLFASIQTSVAFLDAQLCDQLSGLWIFEAPFLPETAAEVFAPLRLGKEDQEDEARLEERQKQVLKQLHILHQRGLLAGEQRTFRDGTLLTYRLLPTMRPYVRDLDQSFSPEELQVGFASVYGDLVRVVYNELDRGGALVWLAEQSRVDFERGMQHTGGEALGWYQNRWGWVLGRLGDRQKAHKLLLSALEIAQGQYPDLELQVINNMAMVYRATGQPEKAMELFEQALPIRRQVGDRAGEAITCFNMAMLLRDGGDFNKALDFLRQAVALERQVQHPDYERDSAMLAEWETAVKKGEPLPKRKQSSGIPQAKLQTIVSNTIAVMTVMTEKQSEWRGALSDVLQQVQSADQPVEVEFFTALLSILDGDSPSLSPENPYTTAFDTIQAGIADGGAGLGQATHVSEAESEAVMTAIRAYLEADDISGMQQVIEDLQETLFSDEVTAIFQSFIQQALQDQKQQAVDMLEFQLGLLQACRTEGIATAFGRHEAAAREAARQEPVVVMDPPAALPEDFVARCVLGIMGTPQEKQAAFNYLVELAPSVPDAGELIQIVQQAIFGADPDTMGHNLTGEYVQVWDEICNAVSNM